MSLAASSRRRKNVAMEAGTAPSPINLPVRTAHRASLAEAMPAWANFSGGVAMKISYVECYIIKI